MPLSLSLLLGFSHEMITRNERFLTGYFIVKSIQKNAFFVNGL